MKNKLTKILFSLSLSVLVNGYSIAKEWSPSPKELNQPVLQLFFQKTALQKEAKNEVNHSRSITYKNNLRDDLSQLRSDLSRVR
jgi:hypothetical protein